MKKFVLALTILTLSLGLAACSMEFSDPIADCVEAYNRISEATHIHQTTEVLDGTLAMFVHEKDFVLDGNAYTLTETQKKLNNLNADSAYTVTVVENGVAVEKADTFAASMNLSSEFLKPGYYTQNNVFRCGILDRSVDDVFGLDEGHAEMTNVVVEMTSSADRITKIVIRYNSDSDASVRITITFKY